MDRETLLGSAVGLTLQVRKVWITHFYPSALVASHVQLLITKIHWQWLRLTKVCYIKTTENQQARAVPQSVHESSFPLFFCPFFLLYFLLSFKRSPHGLNWLLEFQLLYPHSRQQGRKRRKVYSTVFQTGFLEVSGYASIYNSLVRTYKSGQCSFLAGDVAQGFYL